MSLHVEVYVNNRLVARANVTNQSDLADISDYKFEKFELGARHLGIKPSTKRGFIEGHERRQSVWKLVEKVAAAEGGEDGHNET